MKTITMDFDEYEAIIGERNKSVEELIRYVRAIETVFGKVEADGLLIKASQMESSSARMALQRAVMEGKY
jgi:hypothetical protein